MPYAGPCDEKKKVYDSTSSTIFSTVLCNATSRSGEGACLNHDVSEFVEQRETIEVGDTTTSLEHIPNEQPRDSKLCTFYFRQRIVRSMAKTKLADWSRACTNERAWIAQRNGNVQREIF